MTERAYVGRAIMASALKKAQEEGFRGSYYEEGGISIGIGDRFFTVYADDKILFQSSDSSTLMRKLGEWLSGPGQEHLSRDRDTSDSVLGGE